MEDTETPASPRDEQKESPTIIDCSYEENDDESKEENYEGFNGSGRTVTLQMLLAANVLQPGRSTMTIEYLGQKFVGDLLPDGKIKSQETETVFLSPSAWAMHCKRIINPDKKSGCGWASVKYKGKKLDAYKATWMRKCAQQKESTPSEDEQEAEQEKKSEIPPPLIKRIVVPHNTINNRNVMHDANTMIESVPFSSINKMQPFLITISSTALLLADFHCHLTAKEVCGYFGGSWDVNSHTLTISKAFPCQNTRFDRHKAADVEYEIQKNLVKDQLSLVGWYHSHPNFQAEPTLRDCDAQLDYQIKMRGPSDVTYSPCIALIFSPYFEENENLESILEPFWVLPPPENRQMFEYGRPMLMQYKIQSENEISAEVFNEMQQCVDYYNQFRNEVFSFTSVYRENITYLEKLKTTLFSKFPQTGQKELWNFICKILGCEEEPEFIPPKIINKQLNKGEIKTETKEEDEESKRQSELKILSLQEQLCLPSGLNMNPTRYITTTPSGTQNATNVNATTASSSPRDSPITIPSNSASPAKFELPIRASPSPVKSDTSSNRTRNSPAPSPGKFSISDTSRNSPSITPNKYEHSGQPSTNDLMAASLALAGQLPSNFLPSDLNLILQQQQKDYGNTSLNQLAAAALKVGNKNSNDPYEKSADAMFSSSPFAFPNMSKNEQGNINTSKQSKQDIKGSKNSPGTSYKTKLMKELEDLKNDPIKISELMRSPEYAALLLQQAEALGATTLGSLGFTSDFSMLGNPTKKNAAEYANLLQASKLLGYDAYMQQTKSTNDLNVFLQQQMGTSSKKQQQQQQQDYSALLQTYSKLFDTSNIYASNKSNVPSELSALLNSNNSTSKKKDSNEMLNQLLQSDKNADLNALLYNQSKAVADLNTLFVPPTQSPSSSKNNSDLNAYYSQLTQEKMQDYASLFQQHHGKYGIPDPLSKSTLAANNMFMSPSALLKLQQESLNAMMMKPPKSSSTGAPSSSSSRMRESSASPALERLTPTKSNRENPTNSNVKYNFSAVDLAISSVAGNSQSGSPPEMQKRSAEIPAVDLSRIYQDNLPTKKRMEFSSIADLAGASTAKMSKLEDREDSVLNLSSNE